MPTVWKATVIAKVWIGLTVGRMANTVSPTSPREVDATPDSLTASPDSWPRLSTVET